MKSFRPETNLAIDAVQRALVTAGEGTGNVRFKLGRDVVTDTDEAVEDAIREQLENELGYPVIGEERGGEAIEGQPYWLLDPICGTRNFASGIPLFAVNLALVEHDEISIGVVGDGGSGRVHVAERGQGAVTLCDDVTLQLGASATSRVVDFGAWPAKGPERDNAAAVVARAIAMDSWDVRCLSSTLSLAYVAQGRIACCVLFAAPDLVHVAAGALLAGEAGALVTDIDGTPWSMESRSLVTAANADVLQYVIELCRSSNTYAPPEASTLSPNED